jgi:hypothetical protein
MMCPKCNLYYADGKVFCPNCYGEACKNVGLFASRLIERLSTPDETGYSLQKTIPNLILLFCYLWSHKRNQVFLPSNYEKIRPVIGMQEMEGGILIDRSYVNDVITSELAPNDYIRDLFEIDISRKAIRYHVQHDPSLEKDPVTASLAFDIEKAVKSERHRPSAMTAYELTPRGVRRAKSLLRRCKDPESELCGRESSGRPECEQFGFEGDHPCEWD